MNNAKTKFSYTTADGIVETRTSSRAYTHVVVGRRDLVKERAEWTSEPSRLRIFEAYVYLSRCASTTVGETFRDGRVFVTQEMHDESVKIIRAYPTADEYVAAMIAEGIERINAQEGDGDVGMERVLKWSRSASAAQRGANDARKWHVDVRVVSL
ncbi:hypothetical protein [Burkholderia ambifaria]|uniref:hypothetical protein n=1 Tax=Burkholderia ambifaria TaxID=152480 RepID=UPI00158A737B|nr:hypothetical protein [Burkholderia ambifaria]